MLNRNLLSHPPPSMIARREQVTEAPSLTETIIVCATLFILKDQMSTSHLASHSQHTMACSSFKALLYSYSSFSPLTLVYIVLMHIYIYMVASGNCTDAVIVLTIIVLMQHTREVMQTVNLFLFSFFSIVASGNCCYVIGLCIFFSK